MLQHLKNNLMLNSVKGLSKVQLKDYDWTLGLFTLMNILKTPGQTILNRPTLKEPILIFVDALKDHPLQSIGQQFC